MTVLTYASAGLLGALVGFGELASRYRDRPSALLAVAGAWLYLFINVAAALGALVLVRAFGWTFGAPGGAVRVVQVLVAGLGSAALFRSALFTVRMGGEDVPVGPSVLLTTLLGVADRSVDRRRANVRLKLVSKTMAGISFDKSRVALPTLCLASLQNVSQDDQRDLGRAVDTLAAGGMTDAQKVYCLGLLLTNIAGPDVVVAAVRALRGEISV